MHMSDALLSPAVGATFWAGTLGTIAWCSRKLRENLDEKMVPLMGVIGAFIFAAQMINFTIPATGSSGHLGGGMILAILLGPYAAFIVMASVLTVQAFFFADGGLLALGCNIWNLGIYPCFIAYPLVYKPLTRGNASPARIMAAAILSAIIGLQLGAFSVVLETILSGRSELAFSTFSIMMLPIHLAIGVVEGLVTAGVINYVRVARPDILESVAASRPLGGVSIRNIAVSFLVIALLTGGVLSWFASKNPDGLEWAIEKIYGKSELPEQKHGVAPALKKIQEKTAFLPDYSFTKGEDNKEAGKPREQGTLPPVSGTGSSFSGLIGAGIVLSIILLIGMAITFIRRRRP
ncbi:MAG: cobalamin biosynthesis protein CbiM [Thermodesulfovibrio sp.]|nr:cobalamin biosynthesis protein CbiM [Thermodesulfovibrio sp.]